MHDFKVGDRVKIVRTILNGNRYVAGDTATVKENEQATRAIYCDIDRTSERELLWAEEMEPLTAPDLITINRADLPEVTVKDVYGREYLVVDGSTYANELSADEWKKSAVRRYALAEFLEACEKAAEEAVSVEKEAAAKLTKRRDELAEVVAKNAGWNVWAGTEYADHQCEAQAAIDMMITAEYDRG